MPESCSARPEAETVHKDLNRSEQEPRRSSIQDTKGQAAKQRNAEIREGLAIHTRRKFSFSHRLHQPCTDVLRERPTLLDEKLVQVSLFYRNDKGVGGEKTATVSWRVPAQPHIFFQHRENGFSTSRRHAQGPVLRPASAFTCCGLTNIRLGICSSRTFHTGRQYCPVASITTSVTPHSFIQSRNLRKSRVKVRNSRFSGLVSICPCGGNTCTVSLFLCTSMPQQRRSVASVKHLLRRAEDAEKLRDNPTRVHPIRHHRHDDLRG